MPYVTWLAAELRAWGLEVIEIPGWRTRGRPGSFAPRGVMMHHTAAGPGAAPSLELVRSGTARLPGPLGQVLVGRDLRVRVVAAGLANHAGRGAYEFVGRDRGNRDLVGVELEHRGDATESWTGPMMRTSALVAAAILHRLNQSASRVIAHKEYAPTRKSDPYGWNMAAFRSQVARLLATDGRNPLMALTDAEQRELLKRVRDLPTAVWREDIDGHTADSMGTLLVNTAYRVRNLAAGSLVDALTESLRRSGLAPSSEQARQVATDSVQQALAAAEEVA